MFVQDSAKDRDRSWPQCCAGCNIRLVEALAKDLPIFYSHAVTGIDYCEAGVAVHTAKQTFTGQRHPDSSGGDPDCITCDNCLHRTTAGSIRCAFYKPKFVGGSCWCSNMISGLAADAVLVTASLGVLKAGSIKFHPPLPQRKQDAIARMGFGILNKVCHCCQNRVQNSAQQEAHPQHGAKPDVG